MVILMKNNVIEYKGYHTHVEYSAEDRVLHGKIEGIKDLVTFECENAAEAEKAFQEAVDDYLLFCEDVGKEPNKPYNGVFNIRISPELHRQAALAADRRGDKLNTFVREAIEHEVNGKKAEQQTLIFLPETAIQKYVAAGAAKVEQQERISYASRT